MMLYVRVDWEHDFLDEALTFLSEISEDSREEVRRVQIFRDGRLEWAADGHESDSTTLSEVPFPPLSEIASQPEFRAVTITAADFEAAWIAAQRDDPPPDLW